MSSSRVGSFVSRAVSAVVSPVADSVAETIAFSDSWFESRFGNRQSYAVMDAQAQWAAQAMWQLLGAQADGGYLRRGLALLSAPLVYQLYVSTIPAHQAFPGSPR